MKRSLQRCAAVGVAFLVLQTSNWAVAAPQAGGAAGGVERQVRRVPAGSKVQVELKNKEKLKGRLGSVSGDGFDLEVAKGGAPVKIGFTDVQSVHRAGLSTGTKVAIGLGIFAGVAALVAGLVLGAIGSNG